MMYSFTTFSQTQRYIILSHFLHFFHFFLSLDFTCGLIGFKLGKDSLFPLKMGGCITVENRAHRFMN